MIRLCPTLRILCQRIQFNQIHKESRSRINMGALLQRNKLDHGPVSFCLLVESIDSKQGKNSRNSWEVHFNYKVLVFGNLLSIPVILLVWLSISSLLTPVYLLNFKLIWEKRNSSMIHKFTFPSTNFKFNPLQVFIVVSII